MPVSPPTIEQLREIARRYELHLDDAELRAYGEVIAGSLDSFRVIEELTDPQPGGSAAARDPGSAPRPEENPLGAWAWRCEIRGAPDGPLAGKRVAIKDSICVAGLPLRNGSAALEGYVADEDATVVARILAAGGTIVGKTVCEDLCLSGGSFATHVGPVRNPHDPSRSAGGSSSGSAVVLVTGEADMALGGDQGGSIRMPSSFSGTYGLKPTYGLVPYTGVFPAEPTLDHVGPMAASVRDVALLLAAVAGPDGEDPRQQEVHVGDYLGAVEEPAAGLRVAVVEEGFGLPAASEPDVDELVRQAAARFAALGAEVAAVSIPLHRKAPDVLNGIVMEGVARMMLDGDAAGIGAKGRRSVSLVDAYARGRVARADELSPTVKLTMLFGQYLHDHHHGHYYALAQNLVPRIAAAYDAALASADVLVMPTTPMKATPIPAAGCGIAEFVARAFEMAANTCAFNLTGHPAMSVPCGTSDGLPVGMMLVGRRFDERSVLRAAALLERTGAYEVRRTSDAAA